MPVAETITEEVYQHEIAESEEILTEEINEDQTEYVQDEKSSSFPFGTLQSDMNTLHDQSSAGVAMDINAQPTSTESIDNFLANLVEDNANSFPSVSDENTIQSSLDDKNSANNTATDGNKVANDNNSSSNEIPAISEDLPNGCSQDTKVEDGLDAEMVSEDELPAPAKLVDDAEEVSDEEPQWPQPKLGIRNSLRNKFKKINLI